VGYAEPAQWDFSGQVTQIQGQVSILQGHIQGQISQLRAVMPEVPRCVAPRVMGDDEEDEEEEEEEGDEEEGEEEGEGEEGEGGRGGVVLASEAAWLTSAVQTASPWCTRGQGPRPRQARQPPLPPLLCQTPKRPVQVSPNAPGPSSAGTPGALHQTPPSHTLPKDASGPYRGRRPFTLRLSAAEESAQLRGFIQEAVGFFRGEEGGRAALHLLAGARGTYTTGHGIPAGGIGLFVGSLWGSPAALEGAPRGVFPS